MNPSLGGSILGFLPRTVLLITTRPSVRQPPCKSVRNHWPMFTHSGEGVQYLTSGPYETGCRVSSAHGWFTASPEVRYCMASAPIQKSKQFPVRQSEMGPLREHREFRLSGTAIIGLEIETPSQTGVDGPAGANKAKHFLVFLVEQVADTARHIQRACQFP